MNTIDTVIRYRKTRDGEWVAFGPRAILTSHVVNKHEIGEYLAGYIEEVSAEPITITKKNGDTKTEWVRHVGKGFDVDGVEYAYGYLFSQLDMADAANAATNRYEH